MEHAPPFLVWEQPRLFPTKLLVNPYCLRKEVGACTGVNAQERRQGDRAAASRAALHAGRALPTPAGPREEVYDCGGRCYSAANASTGRGTPGSQARPVAWGATGRPRRFQVHVVTMHDGEQCSGG